MKSPIQCVHQAKNRQKAFWDGVGKRCKLSSAKPYITLTLNRLIQLKKFNLQDYLGSDRLNGATSSPLPEGRAVFVMHAQI